MSTPPTPGPSPDSGGSKNQLNLDPNLLSKAKGEMQCKPGDTYTIELTVRSNTTGGFDVVDVAEPMSPVDGAMGPAEEENDDGTLSPSAEEKVLGYKRPQRSMPNFA